MRPDRRRRGTACRRAAAGAIASAVMCRGTVWRPSPRPRTSTGDPHLVAGHSPPRRPCCAARRSDRGGHLRVHHHVVPRVDRRRRGGLSTSATTTRDARDRRSRHMAWGCRRTVARGRHAAGGNRTRGWTSRNPAWLPRGPPGRLRCPHRSRMPQSAAAATGPGADPPWQLSGAGSRRAVSRRSGAVGLLRETATVQTHELVTVRDLDTVVPRDEHDRLTAVNARDGDRHGGLAVDLLGHALSLTLGRATGIGLSSADT